MSKTVKAKVEAPKMIDTYFNDVIKYIKQFGENTVIYMQVGDFYEIYSCELPDGTRIGCLEKINDMCNLNISQKKVCLGISNDAKVFMCGFPLYMLDKYINILVDENSWTVVVIKQDEQCAGTTRSVEGIYSPGTNLRTSNDSNTIVMIVIEKVKSRINKNQSTIYIGMSSIDSITSQTTVYETFSLDQNTVLSFDEIQKFISAKNPREVLIEASDLNITEEDLVNALNLNNRTYRYNFIGYSKIEKTLDTQIKFFDKIYQNKTKVSVLDHLGLTYKEYGRLSLMLLLRYILDHSTIMLNKIYQPEVCEINTQLILANNSLEQLNIIDNRYSSKETSLIKILDLTSTVIGRRAFRNRLLNPIRSPEILNEKYQEIKAMMDYDTKGVPHREFYQLLENDLKNIRDMERMHRRIAMGNLMPNEIGSLIVSYKSIQALYNNLSLKKSSVLDTFLPEKDIWNSFIKSSDFLEKTFDLEKTNFNTLEKVDKNFFNFGHNEKLDEHQIKINHWLEIFKEFVKWIDDIVSEKDTNKMNKKVAKYDFNEQFQHHIYITRNRYENFQKKLKELTKQGVNEVVLKVPKDENELISYSIPFNSIKIENKSRSATNNDVVIILENTGSNSNSNFGLDTKSKEVKLITLDNEMDLDTEPQEINKKKPKKIASKSSVNEPFSLFDKLNYKLRSEMEKLKVEVISVYKETIKQFSDDYLHILTNITQFISKVDVVKAGAKMAIEKSYSMPIICLEKEKENDNKEENDKKENQSFISFKGIRHPIIEHINQKVEYIDNDLSLGKDTLDGILLFGVNASGKSSLMKAIGINLIMAQAGFFVAAKELKYYPFDYLFTRIWNNDNIFKGQSTFEVEISELKSIIKHAGKKSLVLGDELCSGTETVSASAIVTAGIKKLSASQAKFIFATHLHFLADNQHLVKLENVKNYHLSVIFDKAKDKLIYDRKLKEGSGPSTYGLEVCKAMGLDDDFLEEAFKIRNEITNEITGTFLNNKPSKYNSNVRIDVCQICKGHGEDVHHIKFQCNADQNGKIGSIDKNRESNLVVLCKKCHTQVHLPKSKLIINGYIESSQGIILDFKNLD